MGPEIPALSAAFPQDVRNPSEVDEVLFAVVSTVIASLGVASRAAFNGPATGIALTDPSLQAITPGNLNVLNRQNYSFPPDLGARPVTMTLNDHTRQTEW